MAQEADPSEFVLDRPNLTMARAIPSLYWRALEDLLQQGDVLIVLEVKPSSDLSTSTGFTGEVIELAKAFQEAGIQIEVRQPNVEPPIPLPAKPPPAEGHIKRPFQSVGGIRALIKLAEVRAARAQPGEIVGVDLTNRIVRIDALPGAADDDLARDAVASGFQLHVEPEPK